MRNKIIFPALIGIWTVIVIIATDIILLGSKMMQINNDVIVSEQIDAVILRMCITGVIISVIVFIILKNTALNITNPIEVLTREAKNCKEGDYKHQLRDYNIEEMQNLAYAFDGMGEELKGTIRKIKYQNLKLKSMFECLEEGIIILDKKGYIDETNELAKQLLGVGEIYCEERCQIINVLRDNEFIRFIHKGLELKKSQDIEIKINDNILYITMVPVERSEKVYAYLLLIRDVTKLRGLEELKYQFVTNVSHEIKTPLTSIEGFAQTLQQGAIDNSEVARRFVNIIDIEAKRLHRLIDDILTLSEIENMNVQEFGNIEVSDVIKNCVLVLEEQANKKDINIKVEIMDAVTAMNMKEDHMTILIMNILGNAIKYTERGEIIVRPLKEDNNQIVEISDTGIGIPEESIPHIFTRFYRVDKSRSRKNGGTGLGLSIVKHIAELYDINIKVESKLELGTKFTLKM